MHTDSPMNKDITALSIDSAEILYGAPVREHRAEALRERIKQLGGEPHLVILQVGHRPDSDAVIRAKNKFAQEIGAKVSHVEIPEKVILHAMKAIIKGLNEDVNVHGIIVQLPLPTALNEVEILDSIAPEKDVDGLSAVNVKKWLSGNTNGLMPATARGVKALLDYYQIPLEGKKVTVVGRSLLVGKPMAALCLAENATVTIAHSQSKPLESFTKDADILIVATGKEKLIGPSHVRKGQVVIDIGINRREDGTLTGDVDFEAVSQIVEAITPVPKGVGVMTVLALFENLVDACYTMHIRAV